MGLLICFLSIALGVSFLCSLLEAVLFSVTTSHIALLVKNKHRSGRILKNLKDNFDRSLSAILTLNTMSHTIGAAGVGAQAQRIYGDEIIAVTSGILTFLMLFVAEIVPKSIGVTYWKKLAPVCAYLIRALIVITYPLVIFFEIVARVISGGKKLNTRMSREEMIVVAELGQTDGTLVERETRIIRNLLRLNNIYVQDVMTPRTEMFIFQKDLTVGDVMEKFGNELYSRVPVYGKSPDDVVGLALRFNIFNADSDGLTDMTMESLMTPIHRVRSSQPLAKVLDEFILRREHLFLVIDENERTAGIITLEDAIETLLGVEIEDEIDTVEELREHALAQWRERMRTRPPHKRVENPAP